MTEAQRRAAGRALAQLAAQGFEPDRIVLDGKHDYLSMPRVVRTIVKGDQKVLSVAAASVIAKTTRDAMMAEEAEHYPAYGFESNRGYPAPHHKCALAGYGPSAIHRRSWIFMDYCLWGGIARFERQPTLFSGAGFAATNCSDAGLAGEADG
jgi:ribonuclease HII